MTNNNVRIRYRPVKIGWCVQDGNLDHFRRALRLTHTLWGGKYNPIIPVGAAVAKDLVRQFRVDLLFGLDQSSEIDAFIGLFPHLSSPLHSTGLFEKVAGRIESNYLDVSHPLKEIVDAFEKNQVPSNPYGLVYWPEDDPLRDLLLATFGAYPSPEEVGRDYEHFILENIKPSCYNSNAAEPLPGYLMDLIMPSNICSTELIWDRVPSGALLGFYAGRANEFEDLTNYWNLRAADLNVLFLDPDHSQRLQQFRDDHVDFIAKQQAAADYHAVRVQIWSRSQEVIQHLGFDQHMVPQYTSVEGIACIRDLRPPLHHFSERTVLATLSEKTSGGSVLALQLPEKPFGTNDQFHQQQFVVSVRTPSAIPDSTDTLWIPYLPELNNWYGRELVFNSRAIRSEIDGVGIISDIDDESVQLSLIKKLDLTRKLFDFVGIDAQQSLPGRIASRLVTQLGGLEGCRVLKIAGVRKLIKEYSPLQEFTRGAATGLIGNRDPATGLPDFSDYEDLFIEPRRAKQTKLTPDDALSYLLDKGIFRIGLTLGCTVCELEFWISLDDVSTYTVCDLCGSRFNVTSRLKDRDWRYRRSGLFGRDNNQEGSIPVALTLQRLASGLILGFGGRIFTTNMWLEPLTATIEPCETDIFVAIQDHDQFQVAVGECKDAGGAITAEDARKMAKVADAFLVRNLEPYIIFSKTSSFTPEDIAHCRQAQPKNRARRVIMLSKLALELHGFRQGNAEAMSSARSLPSLAEATHDVFFSP